MVKRWIVELAAEERTDLEALTRRGEAPVRKVAHARALLLADDGLPDAEIALRLGRSESFAERTRKRFVQNGPEDALSGRPRPGAQPKLDDRGRATLIAVACSQAPERRTGWTLQLLADELVRRQVVPAISNETIPTGAQKSATVHWHFTTAQARTKLPRSYLYSA
jgi:transposase